MDKQLTYESAFEELETIYAAINNDEVSIDELAKKVKRAALLISLCQAKLKSTEDEISKILSTLTDNNQKNATEPVKPAPEAQENNGELPF